METLTMVVSKISMNVASITETVTIHGFTFSAGIVTYLYFGCNAPFSKRL